MIYLFDFDGTLVDSMPTYIGAMLKILDGEGVSYADDVVKVITPLGLLGTARYFVSLGVTRSTEELVEQMRELMYEAYVNDIPAKENVERTLRALRDRGDSLNVLTASPHATLDPCLRRLGLYDLFDNVWSCDDFGTTKADPEIYLMAAQRLGARPSDVLFLDDNINADLTAMRAGMRVCGVYDASSAECAEEMMRLCDGYVRDLSQLLDMEI